MRAHEIFYEMTPDLSKQIFTELRDLDRNIYKQSLSSLAAHKKLRPVFVQRKPIDQQIDWMHKTLKLKSSDGIGEHLLQIWLLKCHPGMLTTFLDAAGIEHDGEGGVETLPESLDTAKLKTAADTLFEKFSPPVVAVYLRLFQLQRPGGWEELAALIGSDERFSQMEEKPESEEKTRTP